MLVHDLFGWFLALQGSALGVIAAIWVRINVDILGLCVETEVLRFLAYSFTKKAKANELVTLLVTSLQAIK